ncbi:MAG TPA: succinate dehydrogenase cytochrome b subunit [Xanthomonadales bacterium]|nr:succinate dehydrogenase cytochrome b subunit [Xanthomonadales bacterium]
MTWLLGFWRSTIGAKVTMAVTGLLLFVFVVAHLLGNLKLLAGPASLNAYAKMLSDLGSLLWAARIGLLVVFVLHVWTGLRLARRNRVARPVRYEKDATIQATFASRSMVFSGVTLLVFVIYHLMHFTFGVTNPEHFAKKAAGTGSFAGHDVYSMVVASFRVPAIALAYAAFQLVLWLHLRHGVQSLAQTLGINHPRHSPWIGTLSVVLATVIAGGNLLLALSVMTGLVGVAP